MLMGRFEFSCKQAPKIGQQFCVFLGVRLVLSAAEWRSVLRTPVESNGLPKPELDATFAFRTLLRNAALPRIVFHRAVASCLAARIVQTHTLAVDPSLRRAQKVEMARSVSLNSLANGSPVRGISEQQSSLGDHRTKSQNPN